jgi:hypothetical protein
MHRVTIRLIPVFLVSIAGPLAGQVAFDSLGLAGSVAEALGPEFRNDSGPLGIVIHRKPGWSSIVGDSIALRYARQVAVGEDTVSALVIRVVNHVSRGDTIVVRGFTSTCDPRRPGMNYWSSEFELLFMSRGVAWEFVRRNWLGVADGFCTRPQ